ncbi:MAG TPA: hypothetical protein GXX75_05310 [Clostridiales bacterium]|nr:hypothetical protein [Clostridiales bacterium]
MNSVIPACLVVQATAPLFASADTFSGLQNTGGLTHKSTPRERKEVI